MIASKWAPRKLTHFAAALAIFTATILLLPVISHAQYQRDSGDCQEPDASSAQQGCLRPEGSLLHTVPIPMPGSDPINFRGVETYVIRLAVTYIRRHLKAFNTRAEHRVVPSANIHPAYRKERDVRGILYPLAELREDFIRA